MKGIIFNITENFIMEHYGEDTFDEIIEKCELETKEPFVGPGTYPSSDLVEIVAKSSEILTIDQAEFLKKLGVFAFASLAGRYPNFVTPYKHPKAFLKTIDGIIHVEVKKLYQDAKPPTFQYSEPNEDELIITYYSKRKLYSLMEGLIIGVADHFKSPIDQTHNVYSNNGAEYCDFHLKFTQ